MVSNGLDILPTLCDWAGVTVSADDGGLTVASHPMIGEAAPAFDLDKVSGGSLSLESLKGRYVVLHFGASW